MFKGKLTIIRPLCYVEEKMVVEYAKEVKLPSHLCKYPFGKDSRRKYIKEFIQDAEKKTPQINIKTNIFKSISRIKEEYIDLK